MDRFARIYIYNARCINPIYVAFSDSEIVESKRRPTMDMTFSSNGHKFDLTLVSFLNVVVS